jgi:hypothetical protein
MEYGVWNIIDVLSFHVSLESVSEWVPDRHPRDPRMTPFGTILVDMEMGNPLRRTARCLNYCVGICTEHAHLGGVHGYPLSGLKGLK